ncbi:toll/interleukin-1 receptor domain-containing protein [bacterium]|nr:toll/interleukin-1 receptor domain-containing protein [bacterium]
MRYDVFISYSQHDVRMARALSDGLRASGYTVWLTDSVAAGVELSSAIAEAIRECQVFIVLISAASANSPWLQLELGMARGLAKQVLPLYVDGLQAAGAPWPALLGIQGVDVRTGADAVPIVISVLHRLGTVASGGAAMPDAPMRAKGYVFLSYPRSDSDFVVQLRDVLGRRGYAYWDYQASERDFHAALYRELEEKIEGAAAFMAIVTDAWRDTEWPAGEYIYAREAGIPVFVIQAKRLSRPMPIILNQQTRIDMSVDFERGVATLEHELDKKGL